MSETHPSPAKRKRTESTVHIPVDVPPSPTRSTRFWMPYGDIVLQVECTQFKVNRDVLGHQSVVFRDLFLLPQPNGDDKDKFLVDGCSMVEMAGDATEDWELLLGVLYEPFTLTGGLPLEAVAAMLRLGRKYEMDMVLQDALHRLHHDFPRSLEAWDARKLKKITLPEDNDDTSTHMVDIVLLLYECGITSSVPAASFVCLQFWSLQHIFLELDNSEHPVPDDLKGTMAIAAEQLCIYQKKALVWLEKDGVIPTVGCANRRLCTEKRFQKYQRGMWTETHEWNFCLLDTWDDGNWAEVTGFCATCSAAGRAKFAAGRTDAWDALPGFFSLPEWGALQDAYDE
ncbi:hypothetical protein C8F01DRAFT_1058194 [Mycena amicta]|nr:hypothetical protein C8F01DRAFT_1058194 [Mycena amicta]